MFVDFLDQSEKLGGLGGGDWSGILCLRPRQKYEAASEDRREPKQAEHGASLAPPSGAGKPARFAFGAHSR